MEKNFTDIKLKEDDSFRSSFFSFIHFIKSHTLTILIVFGAFIIGTVMAHSFSKEIYKTQFVMSPSVNETVIGDNQIVFMQLMQPEELEKDIKNYNLIYNRKKLYKPIKSRNVSDQVSENLYSVELSPIKNTRSSEVLLFVYDPSAINVITQDLLQYLNSNEYMQNEIKLERNKLQVIDDSLNTQLRRMESIKEPARPNQSPVSNLGYFDIYKDISTIQGRIAEVDIRMKKLTGYEISIPPLIPLRPFGLTLIQSLVIFGILGLLTGLIISFFIAILFRKDGFV